MKATAVQQAGYQIIPRKLAMDWWKEEAGKGMGPHVLSIVEFLRRLRQGEALGAMCVYVVGLDELLRTSDDREHTATWMHGILVAGRQQVKGNAIRVVVEDVREAHAQGVVVVLSSKDKKPRTFPLHFIFGNVAMREGGWAFATYTVS